MEYRTITPTQIAVERLSKIERDHLRVSNLPSTATKEAKALAQTKLAELEVEHAEVVAEIEAQQTPAVESPTESPEPSIKDQIEAVIVQRKAELQAVAELIDEGKIEPEDVRLIGLNPPAPDDEKGP